MAKRLLVQRFEPIDLAYEEEPLETFLFKIDEAVKKCNVPPLTEIKIHLSSDLDLSTITSYLTYCSRETDKEMNKRLAESAKRRATKKKQKEQIESYELTVYNRLKKKFEG
jgi:hypothetical protein